MFSFSGIPNVSFTCTVPIASFGEVHCSCGLKGGTLRIEGESTVVRLRSCGSEFSFRRGGSLTSNNSI